MKAKKIAGGFAVTLPIVMLCGFANAADHYTIGLVASHIEAHAKALTCGSKVVEDVEIPLYWTASDLKTEYYAPIWQYKGQVGEMGCVVHASLAKQLYTPFDPNEPPVTKKGKGVAQATSKGASNDLMDGKYESAVQHICTFIDVIDNNARLNTVDDFPSTTAEDLAIEQMDAAQGWLDDLGEVRTCAEILGY